jgi:type I restriction enzyme S subunit
MYYNLTQKKYTDYLHTIACNNVSSYPSINPDDIEDMEIEIEEQIDKQKQIAKLFVDIDNKIELNNKINSELEKMAKTLYEYWFVQFDFPDENKRPYKSANGKMVYNDILKREIPLGWEVKKLSEVCTIKYGKNFSNKDLLENGYDVYGANGIIGKYSTYTYTEPKILIGCRGSVGNVSHTNGKAFITHNSLILDDIKLGFDYLFYHCKSIGFDYLISGSVQPQLTIDNANKYDVLVPNIELVNSFVNKTHPLLSQKINLIKENKRLIELRDFLLPLLMNGQVSVQN